MNDEIKEILQAMAKIQFHGTDLALENKDTKILLDYITNLQQENQRLEENNQNMQEEMARVWEENQKLKEANVYCNRTDCIGRIKDSRKYDSVYQEKEDYKSRCEKAVEYIMVDYNDCKKLIDKDDITDLTDSYWQGVAITSRDLLNILQNGDDSE